jgi:ADP-ribosyl-[dinitrogen reductase] hydrolase
MVLPTPTRYERNCGTLLGLAAGDARGTTIEFRPPGTFEPLTDIVGCGPFHLQPRPAACLTSGSASS